MATKRSDTVPSRSRKTRKPDEAPMVVRDQAGDAEPAAASMATASSDDERRRQIAEHAYYLAAARGFAPGGELDDWLAAERAIDAGSNPARA